MQHALLIFAVQDIIQKGEIHNENVRFQEKSGNAFGAVRYSSNKMIDIITDSCKGNK